MKGNLSDPRLRRLLLVSPHFPPVNQPDMHRARVSLPHFESFGWSPLVLAVDPERVEAPRDPLLCETLPNSLELHRVNALSALRSRRVGLGNVGLRALPWLYAEGARLIPEHGIDLVYFTTTVFPVLILGRLWKRRFGVPYVVDIQDPWVSDYPPANPGLKSQAARVLHRLLEPWAMRQVDGLIAVSPAYIETLQQRYPRLRQVPAATLPFGYAETDFEVAQQHPHGNRFFDPSDRSRLRGVYVGRGGRDMEPALRMILTALRTGLSRYPRWFEHVRLYFVGTDYSPGPDKRLTVEPLAREMGLGDRVREFPSRIPYFEALQLLLDSDFLVVPGSDDPGYTASKIYPYVLARKPLLCVFHAGSSVVDLVRETDCGRVVAFGNGQPPEIHAGRVLKQWCALLQDSSPPPTRWDRFQRFSAREMTGRQCRIFDQVGQAGRPQSPRGEPV